MPKLSGRRGHLLTAVRLALWTGMRRGEILALERDDLNFSAEPAVRFVRKERYFVFESPVGGRAISDIKTGFTGAVRAAGIDGLTFHDLRHTWSTRAAELGVPEPVRRDILGHSSRTMTDSYTHSTREARERAVELVAGYGEARTAEDCVKNAERPTLWLASRADKIKLQAVSLDGDHMNF